jgi:hypothetical protein
LNHFNAAAAADEAVAVVAAAERDRALHRRFAKTRLPSHVHNLVSC